MTPGEAATSPVVKELTVATTGTLVASSGTSRHGNSGNRDLPSAVAGNRSQIVASNSGNRPARPAITGNLPKLRIASKIATTGTAKNLASTGWRIEVTGGGKYWQWRRGSGKRRESRYGGKFRELSPERQAAYRQNVKRRRRAPDHPGKPEDRHRGRPGDRAWPPAPGG